MLWACTMGATIEAERRAEDLAAQVEGGGTGPGTAELLGRLDAEVGRGWQLTQRHVQHSAPMPSMDAPAHELRAFVDRQRARFAAEALGPMRRLAAVLGDYWRRPEYQAAVELAAAKRPCANLRCPALGSAAKPRRCASCKVSKYCCVECQRQAWAGHRQACAQLPGLLATAAQHQG